MAGTSRRSRARCADAPPAQETAIARYGLQPGIPDGKDSPAVFGADGGGNATLAEASRDRLARPLADRKLWARFERATGERVDPLAPPTWAELIAAQTARRAATSENGTREAKELRDAAEGTKKEAPRAAFILSLDGLPRTDAVTRQPASGGRRRQNK